MANEFFIEKVTYMSTDWHDWEQFTDFIEAEPNQYAFPTKQTVAKKIITCIRNELSDITDKTATQIAENIKNFVLYGTPSTLSIEDTYIIESTRYERTLSLVAKSQHIKLEDDYTTISFYVHELEPDHVVYLPTVEYICFPKLAPCSQRCYSSYFHSIEEAKQYAETLTDEWKNYHDGPVFCRTTILIETDTFFDNNEWYQINQNILTYSPELQKNTWDAFGDTHLKNLQKTIANIETKSDCIA